MMLPAIFAPTVNSLLVGATGKTFINCATVSPAVHREMNINTAGLAESLGLATSLGLDLKTVMEVFSQTGANSQVLATDGEDMVNRDHSCFFSGAHAAKDSGIALALAREQGLNLPLAAAAKKPNTIAWSRWASAATSTKAASPS